MSGTAEGRQGDSRLEERPADFPRWPRLAEEDIEAVTRVVGSHRLSQVSSDEVRLFESAVAEHLGVGAAIAVSTGTAAIHLALVALGISPGDEVIVPAYTFVGSASPILYQGARPVFSDVDESTFCIDLRSFKDRITSATKAVIVVHLNGCAADIEAICELASAHGIAVIEDAAQAIGTRIGARAAGTFGSFGCFSFTEEKVVTTGEGGMVVTNDPAAAERLRRLRMHGEGPTTGDERIYWSHELGFSYRMTALQAALGSSQMRRVHELVEARRDNARHLTTALSDVPVQVPVEPVGTTHAFWKYAARAVDGRPARDIVFGLRAQGIPSTIRYPYPIHRQPPFVAYANPCPTADRLSEQLFTLPIHPAVTATHLDQIASAVREHLS